MIIHISIQRNNFFFFFFVICPNKNNPTNDCSHASRNRDTFILVLAESSSAHENLAMRSELEKIFSLQNVQTLTINAEREKYNVHGWIM